MKPLAVPDAIGMVSARTSGILVAATALGVVALALAGCAGSGATEPSSAAPTVGSEQSCEAATLTVTPRHGAAGTDFSVGGDGYVVCEDMGQPTGADPISVVDVHWIRNGETINLGEARVDQDGTLSGSFTVPEDAEPGDVQLMAGDGLHVSSEPTTFTVD